MQTEEEFPFGTWVAVTRREKKLTQSQLADLAGVSGQQISNIETGRTTNPQSRTREKLAKALGHEPPQDVVAAEEKQAEVVGLGPLVGFDPFDRDQLPQVKGVYVFYDGTKRPVYVGRATNRTIAVRVPEHYEKFWFKEPVVDSASYLKIDDDDLCKKIEQVLIKFMRTHLLINKQGVEKVEPED